MEQGTILEILKCIAPPIYNYVHLSKHLPEKMKELTKNLEELNGIKADIERRIETEARCDNDVKSQVENWLGRVDGINKQVEEVEQKSQNVSCLCRGRLAKRALEKIVEVKEEVNKAISSSEEIVIDKPPARGMILPTEKVELGDQNYVKYRESVEGEIMGYLLAADDVGMIGIWGPGGVGKTTLMKNINNNLSSSSVESKFDKVVWSALPYPFNKVKLQDDIAAALNEELPEKLNEEQRAAKILEIMTGKKFVLLLDDAWERFSFHDIGIPSPTKGNGCKVVITTRSTQLCQEFSCDKLVPVQKLIPGEAYKLFLDTVGHDVFSKVPNVNGTLTAIVNECGGLPLAIVAIARSMRGADDIFAWHNALNELRDCVESVRGWEDEIFQRLKFSYNRLKDEEHKECFLFCCLYGKGDYILRGDLIHDWISGGLIKPMKSRNAMFARANEILNRLRNDCLLEEWPRNGKPWIRMHDIMRDMAVRVAGTRFMMKAGMKLTEIPEEDEWTENLEKVSLMRNSISKISPDVCPNCPKLNTLLLSGNLNLRIIPESFFKGMPVLQFLNLSFSGLTTLPRSISSLMSLTTLLLRNCHSLRDVPSLAQLKALKKLDLHGAGIHAVPEGIEELVNLQHLDLHCPRLVEFPVQILKNLSHLETLVVNFSSCWSSAKLLTKEKEMTRLKMPESFVAAVSNLEGLNKYVEFFHRVQKPTQYSLLVGREYQGPYCGDSTKEVIINNLNINKKNSFILLPNDLKHLTMINCSGVESLSEISMLDTRADLRSYEISGGSLQYILDLSSSSSSSSSVSGNLFDTCESLVVSNMDRLHLLVKGGPRGQATSASSASHVASPSSTPSSTVFSNLKTFRISRCGKIKKLFPIELLKGLLNLEEIHISDCYKMEEIIHVEEENQKVVLTREKNIETVTIFITLSKLRVLVLNNLGKLKSIFTAAKGVMVCDSIQRIQINRCPKLARIPLHLSPRPPSSRLEIRVDSRVWWESLDWDLNPTTKDILASFLRPDSDELSLAREFDDLQDLSKCVQTFQNRNLSSYKYIFEANDSGGARYFRGGKYYQSKQVILFGVQMNGGYHVLLPDDLQGLGIKMCSGMESTFIFKMPTDLRSLIIEECKELECVAELPPSSSFAWSAEISPPIFSNLTSFMVYECPRLKKLFPSQLIICLQKLEVLKVESCEELEEIIQEEEEEGMNETTISYIFPKLKELKLCYLKKLKRICGARGVIICDSIQSISIERCRMLIRMPLHLPLSSPPLSLQEINVEPMAWWEMLEWDNPTAKEFLLPLFKKGYSDALDWKFDDLESFNNYVKCFEGRSFPDYEFKVKPKSNADDKEDADERRVREDVEENVSKFLTLNGVEMHGDYPVLLPNNLECLRIINCSGMEISPFAKAGANLRACVIKHCKEFECLLELLQSSSSLYKMLDELRCLMLSKLPNLELLVKLENQATLPSIFSNLKTFVVYKCPKIKKLFPSTLLNCLTNLEQMHVIGCVEMEEIIHTDQVQEGEQETGSFEFPKLKKLTLEKLPKLKRICTARGVMVFYSIQTIQILECPMLRRIPFYLESSSQKPPCLEEIKIESRLWWELLEWDSPTHEQVLLPFLKPGLDDLSTTFCFDDLQDYDECVQSLKEPRRQNLTSYHFIVGAVQKGDYNSVAEDLPRMITLSGVEVNGDIGGMLLDDVQRLHFRDCRGMKSLREFFKRPANLASCLIEKCEELDSVADLLPLLDGLVSLSLRNLPNLQVLVKMENQLVASIFSHLVAFEIDGCPGIKKLFPSELLNGLQNLEEIRVIDCEELEEIISETPEQQREGGNKETLPKLKKLTLYRLPKLKRGVVGDSIQTIQVWRCPRIKNLFPSSQLLNNLEEIQVDDCAEMEEIIEWDEEEKEGQKNETSCTLALPKLKKLILQELPKLKSLYAARGVLACDSLEKIVIARCMMLKRIPLLLPPPPSLKEIITDSEEFWESLEWDNPAAAKEVLDPLLEVDPDSWCMW